MRLAREREREGGLNYRDVVPKILRVERSLRARRRSRRYRREEPRPSGSVDQQVSDNKDSTLRRGAARKQLLYSAL